MTTLSAGAAAGLLVALMAISTTDGHGAELSNPRKAANLVHPGEACGFNPQPDPPSVVPADSSIRPTNH